MENETIINEEQPVNNVILGAGLLWEGLKEQVKSFSDFMSLPTLPETYIDSSIDSNQQPMVYEKVKSGFFDTHEFVLRSPVLFRKKDSCDTTLNVDTQETIDIVDTNNIQLNLF